MEDPSQKRHIVKTPTPGMYRRGKLSVLALLRSGVTLSCSGAVFLQANRILGDLRQQFGDDIPGLIALVRRGNHPEPLRKILLGILEAADLYTCDLDLHAVLDVASRGSFDDRLTGVALRIQSLLDREEMGRLREEVRAADRLATHGQLIAGLQHDINNALMVAYSGLESCDSQVSCDANARVRMVRKAILQAVELGKRLQAFNVQRKPLVKALDANAELVGWIQLLRSVVGEDVLREYCVCPEDLMLHIDPVAFQQVVTNLVLNARDALGPTGTIDVMLEKRDIGTEDVQGPLPAHPGSYAVLSVRDTGSGIASPDLDLIFTSFFTTKSKGKGTGLGLAVVSQIVEQNGGWITVESELGQGTCFTVGFPLRTKKESVQDDHDVAESMRGPKRVLLVDDNDLMRELVQEFLENAGYQVFVAPGGDEALEHISQQPFIDLIVSDVHLSSQYSGPSLLKKARQQGRDDVPCLFVSGSSEEDISEQLRDLQGVSFLSKPFSKDVLIRALQQLLDAHQS